MVEMNNTVREEWVAPVVSAEEIESALTGGGGVSDGVTQS
jgi:hypothetical protein